MKGGIKISNISAQKQQAEQIIRQYADMIYRIAYQNLKNKADAEDIFQDVCLALLVSNAPIFDEAHIKPWLIRVTLNKCKNYHKSAWRRKTEPLDNHTELSTDSDRDVMEELFCLPANYRNAIYLFYYENYSIDEIARLMNKKPSTVGSWLSRARKRLKKIITDGGKNNE